MLKIEHLSRAGLDVPAFMIADGECIAVEGPSGSGKSLFLRAIADLDPNEGTIWLDNTDRAEIPAPQWRRQVMYVSAEPGWWAETVAPHFADWGEALPYLSALGLPDDCGAWTLRQTSTGERQRLALIRALSFKPRVLLLDEPTAALDPDNAARVEETLLAAKAQGTSLIWVTHDKRQAERIAARRIILEKGVARLATHPADTSAT